MRRRAAAAAVGIGLVAAAAILAIGSTGAVPRERGPARAGDEASAAIRTYAESTSAAQRNALTFPRYGMSQGFQPLLLEPRERDELFRSVEAIGSRMIRLDLPWGEVQSDGPGRFDFGSVLETYDAAIEAGLVVLPVTSGVPEWVDPSDPSQDLYFEFLHRAGLELIPRGITAIEIWNEANIGLMTPEDYTTYALIPGAAGFRQAGDELGVPVTILTSGPGPAATGGVTTSPTDFLRRVYEAGGRGYFDAVGMHPYSWPDDPRLPGPSNWMQRSAELYRTMEEHGDSAKRIWATEFGFPTNRGDRGVGEAEQAEFLAAGVALWESHLWAGPLVFYSFRDLAPRDDDPEHNFGVERFDGSRKPSYAVVEDILSDQPRDPADQRAEARRADG